MNEVAATVGGTPLFVREVDAREAELRDRPLASALPRAGTSEGRQLRRWLTQVLVTERVVALEAAALGLTTDFVPTEVEGLPDMTARLEIGSIAASSLAAPLARALFACVTAAVEVSVETVADYRARNPLDSPPCPPTQNTCSPPPGAVRSWCGWTPGGPRWLNWHRATNIPGIRVNPTTPTNTDG